MSNDGDASNRLSDALDQIFSRSSGTASTSSDVRDAEPDEAYELPEIVPATEEPSAPPEPIEPAAPVASAAPTLPSRLTVPGSTSAQPATASAHTVPPAPPTADRPAAPTPTPARGPTTSWADHVAPAPAVARGAGLRVPGRKPRVRRVTRVLRHVDPWSTFKVALLFSLVTYLVALTSGVLLWRVADSTGTLDNVERWFTQFGWETFEFDGGEIFHNAWIIGLFGVVAMTGGLVLLATIFNLVSDIIGGVRLTVLEEEVVERTVSSTRRYVVRQGSAAAGAAAMPEQQWSIDDDADPADDAPAPPAPEPAATAPTADWSVDDD